MSWTPPSVADIKTRFPEFESVADATMQMILDEAIQTVGVNWIEKDRTPAVLYLVAHLMAAQGFSGGSGSSGGGAAVTGAIKKRKVGDVEIEFAGVSASSGSSSANSTTNGYLSTFYGQKYWELLRRNFPAIAVV